MFKCEMGCRTLNYMRKKLKFIVQSPFIKISNPKVPWPKIYIQKNPSGSRHKTIYMQYQNGRLWDTRWAEAVSPFTFLPGGEGISLRNHGRNPAHSSFPSREGGGPNPGQTLTLTATTHQRRGAAAGIERPESAPPPL